tara:strand:+ start:33 stop:1538 length:1506 start_codon:yes stop_codon:yes gene_type:complete
MDKHTIEQMQKVARERGGRCLSKEYFRAKDNLLWECDKGHQWYANADNTINKGKWCRACKGLMPDTIENMQDIAEKRGGQCLSTAYVNNNTKLTWKCSEGHEWEARPSSIKRGTWCARCSFDYVTLDDLDAHAASLGGKCITRRFKTKTSKMEWECKEGHRWEAKPQAVVGVRKTWCSVCRGSHPLSLEIIKDIAISRGGECLSASYINIDSHLKWRCGFGHEWKATSNKVKNGYQWCPTCKSSFGESYCRALFESAFQEDFPRVRPRWLSMGGKQPFELDGYNEKLHLAFEHQGHQHFRAFDSHFHSSKKEKEQQLCRDDFKRKKCSELGIVLIEIPEVGALTSVLDVPEFIQNELVKRGVTPPVNLSTCNVDPNIIFSNKLNVLKLHASTHKGEYLGVSFSSKLTKFLFKCDSGHVFSQGFRTVRKGTWCTKCSGRRRKTIEEMRVLAASKGGLCKSHTYVNSSTKLQWSCAKGHVFEKTYSKVMCGQWCKICKKSSKK